MPLATLLPFASVVVLLAGIIFLLLLSNETSMESLSHHLGSVRPEVLFLAFLSQLAAIAVSTWGWRLSQSKLGVEAGNWSVSFAQMGLLSVGKYLPGKVFGILARGMASRYAGSSTQAVLRSTVLEQIALVHSGVMFGACCFWIVSGNVLAFAMTAFSIAFVLFPAVALWVLEVLVQTVPIGWAWLNKLRSESKKLQGYLTREAYLPIVSVFVLVWVFTALGLYLCLMAVGSDAAISYAFSGFAVSLSYLAGFAVFVVPGGVGVREASIVALLSGTIGLPLSVSIATIHRIVTVAVDGVYAAFALSQCRNLKKQFEEKS